MNDPSPRRTILFYRVTTVVLLGAVAWLGITLRARDEALVEAARSRAGGSPSPRGAESLSDVVVMNVGDAIEQIDSAIGKADATRWLLQTPFGGVKLIALSVRQRVPLHFNRFTHEALLPIYGEQEAIHVVVRDGRARRLTLRPNASTLLSYAPYTTHGWANASTSHAAIMLAFSSASQEPDTYVEPDDDRVALGSEPEVFDGQQMLAELQRSGEPSSLRRLPGMDHRITAVAVSSEAALEPSTDLSAVWVMSGRGRLLGRTDRALAVNRLAIIPGGTSVRIRADAKAPLLVLHYQPARVDVSDIVKNGRKLYSQFDEELLIRDFFRDRHDGVFLDVGCADYQRLSTTYYLEEKLGWSGVAVDALADYAKGYLEHRRRTKFRNYLVTDKSSGPQTFYRAPLYTELSSASKAVARDQQSAGSGVERVEELKVPTITLDALLQQEGIGEIDFMSMDIEEHEPEALAGFDIDRYTPQLVCVEAHRAVADAIYKYFRDHGYVRIEKYLAFDNLNWYFTPQPPAPSRTR